MGALRRFPHLTRQDVADIAAIRADRGEDAARAYERHLLAEHRCNTRHAEHQVLVEQPERETHTPRRRHRPAA